MKSLLIPILFLCLALTECVFINKKQIPSDEIQRMIKSQMIFVEGGHVEFDWYTVENSDKLKTRNVSSFYINRYPVTQAQWKAVMNYNPSHHKDCDSCPIENASMDDVKEFIDRLNQLTGENYRLPTDTEFVYAEQGGNQRKGFKYSGSDSIDEVAWYENNSGNHTHGVGLKKPNELGLYDMTGNINELCTGWDYSHCFSSKITELQKLKKGYSATRGGSFDENDAECSNLNSLRQYNNSDHYIDVGFRLAKDIASSSNRK